MSSQPHHTETGSAAASHASRRAALRAGVAGLASATLLLHGCAGAARRPASTARLPEPLWPNGRSPAARRDALGLRTTSAGRAARPAPVGRTRSDLPAGVEPRHAWAADDPAPALMDHMLPVRRITIHHVGAGVFTDTARSAVQARLESIRRTHRSLNWGDIGYHFLVDPAGRVWQGRPLAYQGAHVRDQNEGNLGVCVLGNFERQRPSADQLAAIASFVRHMMDACRLQTNAVHTHRELAPTACPGRYLQPRLAAMRAPGGELQLA